MSNTSRNKITQNIFSLVFGKFFTLLINFASITLAARYLGVENFGSFSFILAITGIVSKFVDLGQSPIVFREISKDKKNEYLLNTSFSLRVVSFLIFVLLFNLVILVSSFTKLELLLSNIFLLNIFFSSKYLNFRELLDLPFKRSLKMHIPMIITIIDNILFLMAVLIMVKFNYGLEFFGISYVVTNIPGFILMFFLAQKEIKQKFTFSFQNAKWLFLQSTPLFIFVLCMSLFQQLEIILLSSLDTKHSVGIYSAAMRLTAPLSIIPASLVTTLFPIIVSNLNSNKAKVNKLIQLSFKILFIVAFIAAAFFTFKGDFIIQIIFGKEYLQSVFPTKILLWSQIFLFYNFFALDLFTAYGRQKNNSIYSVILLITHLILLLLFIPSFSSAGASIAKILSSFFGFVFIIFTLKKMNINPNFMRVQQIIWVLLVILILFVLSRFSIYLYSIIGLVLIIASLIFLNVFNKDEMVILKSILNSKNDQ